MSRKLISVFRGWDIYERTHGGPAIVDFDLCAPGQPVHFESRREVREALVDLAECLRGETGSVPFLRSRVEGSIAYLRALAGEPVPFEEYIHATLGMAPGTVPDSELRAARAEAESHLDRYGLRFDRNDRARFEREFVLADEAAIKSGIFDSKDLWLGRLGSLSVPVPHAMKLSVRFTSVDAPWANWIAGTRAGFELEINLHPRKKYYRGSPLALCLHEICGHAVQMAIWQQRIEEGTLDDACGITTVHSPETFAAEGLGQTVHFLVGRHFPLPPELWLRKSLQYYELLVMQNAQIRLYQGEPFEQALDYAEERLSLSNREDIESELRERFVNPLSRTYQLSYSIAERALRQLIAPMSDAQMSQFFRRIYEEPMTPAELLAFGERLSHT